MQRGWAVGSGGLILHSRDGGRYWQAQTSGTLGWDAVQFVDTQRGWAVGNEGTILATDDGGETWQTQISGTRELLVAVQFVDAQRGWTVGNDGTILATNDGGETWQAQMSGTTAALNSVQFVDAQRGWAVGNEGTILATDDGGETWQAQISGTRKLLFAVQFVDVRQGWAVGEDGTILATDNGGETWQTQISGTRKLLFAVQFVNAQRGWAVGKDGTILATDNGGETWQTQISGTREWLVAVQFVDAQRGWAVGGDGIILATDDGGETWQTQISGTRELLVAVQFVDAQRGWTAGYKGTILTTDDRGTMWQPITKYRRYPAPWYAILIGILLLTGFLVLRPPRPREVRQSVADMLATDRPLRPEDLKYGRDALGIGELGDDLSRFLRNSNTAPPLTIAVTGEWGSGKSSLMNLLREDLKHHGFRPVWFNAWHHQKGEQLLASLFAHIKEQGIPGWIDRGGLDFRVRLALERGRRHSVAYALLLFVFVASLAYGREKIGIIMVSLGHLISHPEAWWTHYASWLGEILSQPFKAFQGVTTTVWLNFLAALFGLGGPLAAFLKAAQGFGLNPARLVTVNPDQPGAKALDPGARARFAREFSDVTRHLRRKMVIFIDDLDRCSQDNLIDVLENVNFLATSGDCFLVLGMSPEWVESCVALKYEQLAKELAIEMEGNGDEKEYKRRFARNYLEKMINIEVPVPILNDTAATLLLTPSKIRSNGSEWSWRAAVMALAPYVLFSAILGYGIWYGISIPKKKPTPWPAHRSWTLGEVQLSELKPGQPLLQFVPRERNTIRQETKKEGYEITDTELKIALEAREKALAKGIVLGSYGSGEDAARLVLRMEKKKEPANESKQEPLTRKTTVVPSGSADSSYQDIELQSRGSLFSAQDSQLEPSSFWLMWILGLVGLVAVVRAFFVDRQDFTSDSPAFAEALKIWQPWIQSRQETPRAIKRYLNRVRFIALRLRGNYPEPGTVALSAIYYFQPDWLMNQKSFEQLITGEISRLLVDSFNLDVNKKGDIERITPMAERLADAVDHYAAWLKKGTPEGEQRGQWPPEGDHRTAVLRVLAHEALALTEKRGRYPFP